MARLKILLAASGGGHLRQLLDLEPFWSEHETTFATEATSLGQSVSKQWPVEFFSHFAFGQRKAESTLSFLRSALANLRDSWVIVRAVKPDVVISTGAGSAFFCFVLGRIMGAQTVLIESFARVRAPSLFGRMARPFAGRIIAQSNLISEFWPKAEICDPIEILELDTRTKAQRALVTVGTQLPFDRLVGGVGALKQDGLLPEELLAQVGKGSKCSEGFPCVESLAFEDMKAELERAKIVFCHGGSGSLIMALRAGCRVVAMPRDPLRGEVYDEHQRELVEAFAARGLIQVANEVDGLPSALLRARSMSVQAVTATPRKLIRLLKAWFPT